MIKKKIFPLFCVLIIVATLSGCKFMANTGKPPELADVEAFFESNQKELQQIAEYLAGLEYEKVAISADNIVAYVSSIDGGHQEKIDLSDKGAEILGVVASLPYTNYTIVSRNENTIDFHLWSGSALFGKLDQKVGIAYVIDGQSLPDIQYCTKVEPMGESNWYYYYSDYNEWRTQ